jgi:hypothetical protein
MSQNRPFAALQDWPNERSVSARKRSSAEGVGCHNSGRLWKACRLCRLYDFATVYLFRGLASTGPLGGRAVRLSEGPLQVGLEIGPIDCPALSLNAPPAPSKAGTALLPEACSASSLRGDLPRRRSHGRARSNSVCRLRMARATEAMAVARHMVQSGGSCVQCQWDRDHGRGGLAAEPRARPI